MSNPSFIFFHGFGALHAGDINNAPAKCPEKWTEEDEFESCHSPSFSSLIPVFYNIILKRAESKKRIVQKSMPVTVLFIKL